MNKIRYKYEGSSYRLASKLKHLDRLGEIRMIKAVRTESWRKSADSGNRYRVVLEKIVVEGKIGKASFGGVCWGYGGTGPHETLRLLKTLGIPQKLAEKAAFEGTRNNSPGTDWQIEYHPGIYLFKQFVESSAEFKR